MGRIESQFINPADHELVMDEICRPGFDPADSPLAADHYRRLTVHVSNVEIERDRLETELRQATNLIALLRKTISEMTLREAMRTYQESMRDCSDAMSDADRANESAIAVMRNCGAL